MSPPLHSVMSASLVDTMAEGSRCSWWEVDTMIERMRSRTEEAITKFCGVTVVSSSTQTDAALCNMVLLDAEGFYSAARAYLHEENAVRGFTAWYDLTADDEMQEDSKAQAEAFASADKYGEGDVQQQEVVNYLARDGDSSPEQEQAMYEEQDAGSSKGLRRNHDLAAGEVGNAGEEEQEDLAGEDHGRQGAGDGAWGYSRGPEGDGLGYGYRSVDDYRANGWLEEDSEVQILAFACADKLGDGEVQQQRHAHCPARDKYGDGEVRQQAVVSYLARDGDSSTQQIQAKFEVRDEDPSKGLRRNHYLAAGEVGDAGEEERGPEKEDQHVDSYRAGADAWDYSRGPGGGGFGYRHWAVGGYRAGEWQQEDSKTQDEALTSAEDHIMHPQDWRHQATGRWARGSKACEGCCWRGDHRARTHGSSPPRGNRSWDGGGDSSSEQVQVMFEEQDVVDSSRGFNVEELASAMRTWCEGGYHAGEGAGGYRRGTWGGGIGYGHLSAGGYFAGGWLQEDRKVQADPLARVDNFASADKYDDGQVQRQGVASCLAREGDSSPEQVQAMFEEQDADLSKGLRLHYARCDVATAKVGNKSGQQKWSSLAAADVTTAVGNKSGQQKWSSLAAAGGASGQLRRKLSWSAGGYHAGDWLQEDSKAQAETFASANKYGDGKVQQQEVASYRAGDWLQKDGKAQTETVASADKYSDGEVWQQEDANYPARNEDSSPKQVQAMFVEQDYYHTDGEVDDAGIEEQGPEKEGLVEESKVMVASLLMHEAGIHIAVNDEMAQSFLDFARDQPGEVLKEVRQCGGDLQVAKGIIQALVGGGSAKTETRRSTDRTTVLIRTGYDYRCL